MTGKLGWIISCVVLLELALDAHAYCYRKSVPKNQEYADVLGITLIGNYSTWACVQSIDFVADLERAPKPNVTQISFSMSKIGKLRSEAFAKFATKLIKIELLDSKIVEIEDGALTGLKELKSLVLSRNGLTAVKAAWFKDTANLLELNLAYNHIRVLEVDFLKQLPSLASLDLRGNEIVGLPVDFLKQLPVTIRRFNVFCNPLNYPQLLQVIEWHKAKNDKTNEAKLKELKHVANITKACLEDKTIADKSPDTINKCVEEKMDNELASISGNKTAVKA